MQDSSLNIAIGSKDGDWLAGGAENFVDEMGDGRLASRAGDAD